MKNFFAVILLATCILFQGNGVGASDSDWNKGQNAYDNEDFSTALSIWESLAAQGNLRAQYSLGGMYEYGKGVPKNIATALKWYRLAAEQGDDIAQNRLGEMYEYGEGVPKNIATALKWFRLAAKQGHPDAQVTLGLMYENGEGVPKNNKTAVKWFRLAAKQGDADAQVLLGTMYRLGKGVPKNDKTAVKWFRLAAKKGSKNGQFSMGYMYEQGDGVPQNLKTAVKLYTLAAEQGLDVAEYALAQMYEGGQGVPQNLKTAMKWFKRAADQNYSQAKEKINTLYLEGKTAFENGDYAAALSKWIILGTNNNAKSAYGLGIMYEQGKGVPQNNKTAAKWYKSAAEQGHDKAQRKLGLFYYSGKGVPKDLKVSAKWYTLAAKQGDPVAQLFLGEYYKKGKGVPKNQKIAMKWLKLSAEQGNKYAQQSLGQLILNETGEKQALKWFRLAAEQGLNLSQMLMGVMYTQGKVVPKDYITALKWHKLAAKDGYAPSEYHLGLMYADGNGVAQNHKTAMKWFKRAAAKGLDNAQFQAARLYRMGKGVPQNYKKAIKWYKLAAAQGYGLAQAHLGAMYAAGHGMPQNLIYAYMWINIAAGTTGKKGLVDFREQVLKKLSPKQIEQAQKLSDNCVRKKYKNCEDPKFAKKGGGKTATKPSAKQKKKADKDIVSASSGTGFAVSGKGHVVTNYHVIEGCRRVMIHHNGKMIAAKVLTFDPQNDLALLKGNFKPLSVFPLSNNRPQLLQEIFVAGYPFGKKISTSVKVTKGIVSSLTGMGNNSSNIQIDAALQPGNSGGPILNDKGNVVGVAVAKLDVKKVLKAYGTIPENTNFGVKTSVLRNVVDSLGISLPRPNRLSMSKSTLGKVISEGTYYLSCWMTMAKIQQMKSRKVVFQNLE